MHIIIVMVFEDGERGEGGDENKTPYSTSTTLSQLELTPSAAVFPLVSIRNVHDAEKKQLLLYRFTLTARGHNPER
jgi:hypothetical protein